MLIVMPRCFSSGALSIWSNAIAWTLGLAAARVFVMAAVSVVLPWSMWPMVPTLRWGLVRSNFSLAMAGSCAPGDCGVAGWRRPGSNRGHLDYEPSALTI